MKKNRRLDPTFLIGLGLAVACILAGLMMEKGDLHDVTQITSAMIVLGGTIGAVVVSTPKDALLKAIKRTPAVFWTEGQQPVKILEDFLRFSTLARRDGTVSLESAVTQIEDPFFRKGMTMVVDGIESTEIREVLEMDLLVSEQEAEEDAKVFEAAGGYAPTVGIIGAVLGLMQVMKHLDNIQDVGRGIAVAFVATVYGVGVANLIFLPIGSKLKAQARQASKLREMIIAGTVAIQEGRNPRIIRQLLEPFLGQPAEDQGDSSDKRNRPVQVEQRKAS